MRKSTLSLFIISGLIISVFSFSKINKPAVIKAIELPTWETKKIAVSEQNFFVLNQVTKAVSVYDANFRKTNSFEILIPISMAKPEPQDISYDNNTLFIADRAQKKIHFFSIDGKFIRTLNGFEKNFIAPSSLLVKDNRLIVADTNRIWILDELGNVRSSINLLPYSNESPFIVKDMFYKEDLLYIASQTMQTVLVFRDNSGWSDFEFYKSIGGIGYESGRFFGLSSVVADGTIFVSDMYRHRIQSFHPLLENSIEVAIQKDSSPTDMAIWKNKLFYVEAESDKIISINYKKEEDKNQVLVSTNLIDFGSNPKPSDYLKHFTIYQKNGFPLQGVVTSDNPLFIVKPNKITGVYEYMTVSLNPNLIKQDSQETGIISIALDSGEKKTVEVKIKIKKSEDFDITLRSNNDISFQKNELYFDITPQNGFTGTLEFSSKSNDLPFKLQWEQEAISITTSSTLAAKAVLLPAIKVPPGFYTVPYQIKATAQKIIKQGIITFPYKGIEATVPGTLLGELFSTDWCPYCPSAHRAIPELEAMYTPDQVNFITYYIDCSDASPQRLCFPEATERKNWYLPSGTPTLILNGTTVKNGGYKSPTETMTKDYKEMIDAILPSASPVSLTGFAAVDPRNRTIDIGATINWLQKMKIDDPRFYFVIVENNIEYPAKNKVNIHDNVCRQFFSLPNPEKNTAYGSQLVDQVQYHLKASLDPVINLDNSYGMFFIQDNATKKIFQSRRLSLTNHIISDFILSSNQIELQPRSKDSLRAAYFLQNLGTQVQEYTLEVLEKSNLPEDAILKVNGNEFSLLTTTLVTLNPFESIPIEIQTKNPITDFELNALTLKVTDQSNLVSKFYSIPIHYLKEENPRFEILYPLHDSQNKDRIYKTDMDRISVVIRTESRTKILEYNNLIADEDGLISISYLLCPGENSEDITFHYPDQSNEVVQFTISRELSIKLTIGSMTVSTNRDKKTIEAPPYIKNGRTMVPLRIIAEGFCCKIEYDPKTQSIHILSKDKEINLQIGKLTVTVNGKVQSLDTPPEIQKGRTFIPLRPISELFGATVDWDSKKQEITIQLK